MFLAGGFDPSLPGDREKFGKLLAYMAAEYERRQRRQTWFSGIGSGVSVALLVLLASSAGPAIVRWIVGMIALGR